VVQSGCLYKVGGCESGSWDGMCLVASARSSSVAYKLRAPDSEGLPEKFPFPLPARRLHMLELKADAVVMSEKGICVVPPAGPCVLDPKPCWTRRAAGCKPKKVSRNEARSVQPEGLYVLGLINQSAAKRAGMEQGDQLVAIDGRTLTNETPFEAAALVQGQQTGKAQSDVTIKVSFPHFLSPVFPH